jgi:uncharacterized protein (TIGR02271 family)
VIDDDEGIITISSEIAVPSRVETVEVPVERPVEAPAMPAEPVYAQRVQRKPAPQSVVADDEAIRVERYEEDLTATKDFRDVGEVRISKDVLVEQESVGVPVRRDKVNVKTRAVNRTATDTSQAFQERTISMSVREEDLEVFKVVRVAEELEIEKSTVQDTERVTDTVRKERIDVQELGEVETEVRSEKPLDEVVRSKD